MAAFDLYRNYDGNGAIVGNLAVQATTTDGKNTSDYAFAHSDGSGGIELVAVNQKTSTQPVTIQIASAASLTGATLYQLAGKTAAVAKVAGTPPVPSCAAGACTLTHTMPSMRATTIVLR